MRRFFVPRLPSGAAVLSGETAHHLRDVLRLLPNTEILLFDGHGHQARALVLAVTPRVQVQVTTEPERAAPPHALELLLGLPKGPAGGRAVRMATEAGATSIHLVQLSRVQVKGDPRARLERVVTEAARQCGRADVPQLHAPASLAAALRRIPAGAERRVATPGAPRLGPASGPAAVLVGPEGGLTESELDRALAAGWMPMGLGQWVLRAETAAGVAVALTAP